MSIRGIFIFLVLFNCVFISAVSLPSGTIYYSTFEGNANDLSGNNNHGTVNGATLVSGKSGQGYSFDGDDYITLPVLTFGTDFTIGMWVDITSLSTLKQVFADSGDGTLETGIRFMTDYINGNNLLAATGQTAFAAGSSAISSGTLNSGPQHIAVSVSGNTATFYINGQNAGTGQVSGKDRNSPRPMHLGRKAHLTSSANGFVGKMDDVIIISRSTTPSEIQTIYLGGFSINTPAPPQTPACVAMTEVCDGADNDCDLSVDEGLVCGKIIHGNPANYKLLIKDLKAGDTLVLDSGNYPDGIYISDMNGQPGNPITIMGPSSGQRAVLLADPNQNRNTLTLNGQVSYVTIKNFEFDGQGICHTFAIHSNQGGSYDHIRIENNFIHDHDCADHRDQATVGISSKGTSSYWEIIGNTITDTGTGMYLGNSDCGNPFYGATIKDNFITRTSGYGFQIKCQAGPGIANVIENNVIGDNNLYHPDGNRPNILTDNPAIITKNFFYSNGGDEPLVQGTTDLKICGNLFLNDKPGAVNSAGMLVIQNHDGEVAGNIIISGNTFVGKGNGIVTTNAPGGNKQIFGNAVFSDNPIVGSGDIHDNIVDSRANAINYLNNPDGLLGNNLDLYPKVGKLTGPNIDLSQFSSNDPCLYDFDGNLRNAKFRGAYSGEGINSGWKLSASKKTEVSGSPTCTPVTEICGNGIDDDCDGIIDDGCAPTSNEIIVSDLTGLNNAIANLKGGQTISIAPGTYNIGKINIPASASGTAQNPTIIKARDGKGTVKFDALGNADIAIQIYASNFVIDGIEVTGGDYHCLKIDNANDVTFKNLIVHDCDKTGPPYDSHAGIKVFNSQRITVTNSEFYQTGTRTQFWNNQGAFDCNQCDGVTFSYNLVHGFMGDITNSPYGFHDVGTLQIKGSSHNSKIFGNRFENNLLALSEAGDGVNDEAHESYDALVYNNLFIGNDYSVLFFDSVNGKFYHNTFYNNKNPPLGQKFTQNLEIKNNILDYNPSFLDGTSATMSNNIVLSSPSDNSLFVSATNFHLKSTSNSALDSGVNVGITSDFDGSLRPQGSGPDIGAYEYNGGINNPTPQCDGDLDGNGVINKYDLSEALKRTGLDRLNFLIKIALKYNNNCGFVPEDACGRCGLGTFNLCDLDECNAFYDKEGKKCEFSPLLIGGKCEPVKAPPVCNPLIETCNNLDDDCDGLVDEDNVCGVCQNGQTLQCGQTDVGLCSYGSQTCSNGQWGSCIGEVTAVVEACNNLDDDCDGIVDEEGVCACVPSTEICDGKDNDCDGQVNEDNVCGDGVISVPITVKSSGPATTSGLVANYPVHFVVPIPRGKYWDTSTFRLVDSNGNTVPAEFIVYTRDWYRDDSIRSVEGVFQPAIPQFTGAGTGQLTYTFKTDGPTVRPTTQVNVQETTNDITVNTGPLKFRINKKNFNLFDEVWLDLNKDGTFSSTEQMVAPSLTNGGSMVPLSNNQGGVIQYDSARQNVKFTIEDSNPMFTVIAAEAWPIYNGLSDHTHGWKVRIYAYANKPYVKIEYLASNGINSLKYASLPFNSWTLGLKGSFNGPTTATFGKGDGTVFTQQVGSGLQLRQSNHNAFTISSLTGSTLTSGSRSDGFVYVSDGSKGINFFLRDVWQKYPMGVAVDGNNKLLMEFFPQGLGAPHYSLKPSQHSFYSGVIGFDDGKSSNADLIAFAKTSQYYPVAVLPFDWYAKAGNMGFGHVFADVSPDFPKTDVRIPDYNRVYPSTEDQKYGKIFNTDVNRRTQGGGGGTPSTANAFVVTGDPADYFDAESVFAEVYARPGWVPEYNFERDCATIHLESTSTGYNRDRQMYKDGTSPDNTPSGLYPDASIRDVEHYWMQAPQNPLSWVNFRTISKDYNSYVLEYRMAEFMFPDHVCALSYPAPATRKLHYLMEVANAAKTVRASPKFFEYLESWTKRTHVDNNRGTFGYTGANPYNEDVGSANFAYTSPDSPGNADAPFQAGFASRAFGYLLDILDPHSTVYHEIDDMLKGMVAWNYNWARWAYYTAIYQKGQGMDGSAQTFVDSQAFVYWITGDIRLWNDVISFVTGDPISEEANDMNGPNRYGQPSYRGRSMGDAYFFVKNHISERDTTPAPSITDLTATRSGSTVTLTWTTPNDPRLESFKISWHELPFTFDEATPNRDYKKVWAGRPVDITGLDPKPGQKQSITFNPGTNGRVYAVVAVNAKVHPLGGYNVAYSNIASTQ